MAEDAVGDPPSPPRLCEFPTQVHHAVVKLDLATMQSFLTPDNVNHGFARALRLYSWSLHRADVNSENEDWPRNFSFDRKHPSDMSISPDTPKWTPIVKAASLGERDVAKLLLVHGANVELGPLGLNDQAFDRVARGPLPAQSLPSKIVLPPACQFTADVHRAAQSQDLGLMISILTHENVNTRLCSGTTPLFLVIASCETNIPSYSSSMAVMNILRWVLALGANVNTENDAWPRSNFSFESHTHDTDPPMQSSAEVVLPSTISGFTPLMKAASLREKDIMELLRLHSADFSISRRDGKTAKRLLADAEKGKGKLSKPLGIKRRRKSSGCSEVVSILCTPCRIAFFSCYYLWIVCTGEAFES
ncbi:hypothetical protein DL96DRAFT_1684385 [Flagelloscypha sp. PMI_526]|nr:hypothetical protein DL96DRAFT_1684385 [Flagelloscypha sp. PMI_526]